MTLHLVSVPHTRSHPDFSHCAFTNKVRTFPAMYAASGSREHILHYGVGHGDEVEVGPAEHIEVMLSRNQEYLLGHNHTDPQRLVGQDANWDSGCYREFNKQLGYCLASRVSDGDLILLPFGPAHEQALQYLRANSSAKWLAVETGIGYPNPYQSARIYESWAWYHYIAGKQGIEGSDYWRVIPPWVIEEEWPLGFVRDAEARRNRLAFVGRQVQAKGIDVVVEVAATLPHVTIACAGQGALDPRLAALPNVEWLGAISGIERAQLYGSVAGVLCPSQFIEPGCQVSMEARVMGATVIAPPRGVFVETGRESDWIGMMTADCHRAWVLQADFVAKSCSLWTPDKVRSVALAAHSANTISAQYVSAFAHMRTLLGAGWYAPRATASASYRDARGIE